MPVLYALLVSLIGEVTLKTMGIKRLPALEYLLCWDLSVMVPWLHSILWWGKGVSGLVEKESPSSGCLFPVGLPASCKAHPVLAGFPTSPEEEGAYLRHLLLLGWAWLVFY